MPKLPVIKPKNLVKVLAKLGFEEMRQRGSHCFFYRRRDHKATVIPMHSKELGKGLLRKILNDIDISVDKLIELLK